MRLFTRYKCRYPVHKEKPSDVSISRQEEEVRISLVYICTCMDVDMIIINHFPDSVNSAISNVYTGKLLNSRRSENWRTIA